jgi:osmotically-inducible protein OsmY
MKSDALIQTEVIQELKYDPRIAHEHLGVAVVDGIVTLSGSVPNYIEKSAAEKAAQRIGGVKAVVEKIEVRIPGTAHKDDEHIAKAIADQFRWHTQVPDDLIKATVEHGWVSLAGTVEWDFQRRAAEKVVKGLTGVRGITNDISLEAKIRQPADIKNKIELALKRAAEREVERLDVQVEGSRVILSGNVRSFAEWRDVTGAAWSTPGVTSVDDTGLKVAA